MDIERLYQDYSVRRAHEGEKHYRLGWVNIPCPFCSGHSGNHLGFNVDKNYYKCWRCGHKPIAKVFCKLFGISYPAAKKLIREYQGRGHYTPVKIEVKRVQFTMPDDTNPIFKNRVAMQYLIDSRGFSRQDAHWVSKRFNLQATGSMGYLGDDLDLSYRIIASIVHEGKVVSWQSRDFTDTAFLKYITCPGKIEIIPHKEVLYNAPDFNKYKIIVLCEGIVDVWKVVLAGFPATCCFGVEYTYTQFKLLTNYDRILLFLDPDKAGIQTSKKLLKQLIFAGVDADIVHNDLGIDAGDMHKYQIKRLMKSYI